MPGDGSRQERYELPGGGFLNCEDSAQEARIEPPKMQPPRAGFPRLWDCGCSTRASAIDLQIDGDTKECTSQDGEANFHGLLMAALELQERRTSQMHAEVLGALGTMERRILSALERTEVGSFAVRQDFDFEAGGAAKIDPQRDLKQEKQNEFEDELEKAELEDETGGIRTRNTNGSLLRIDLCSEEPIICNLSSEEPSTRRGWRAFLKRFVKSSKFLVVVSTVIWASVIVSFLEEQYGGYKANVALGLASPGSWGGAESCFAGMSHIFNFFFVGEVIVCLSVSGIAYLKDPWGCFDTILVVLSCLDSYVLQLLGQEMGQDFMLMRLLRVTRLLRTLQVAREMSLVQPLHLFIRTIAASMATTMWSLIFLAIVQLIGALFIARSLHDFIMDPSNPLEDRVWCNRMYGSSAKAFYTFFELTFSGGWPNYVRPLVEKVGLMYAIFFVFYIAVWVFAVLRIISALFIKETLAQAAKDERSHALNKKAEHSAMVKRLKKCFMEADTSQDGKVTSEEFAKFLSDPEIKNWLEIHEVHVGDPSRIWELVDNGEKELNLHQFVAGMLRLKGVAKAHDMHTVLVLCQRIHERLDEMEGKVVSLSRRGSFVRGPPLQKGKS